MTDGQAGGEFLERGGGRLLDLGRQFFWVELAPFAPGGFGGEDAGFGGGEITIDGAPRQREVLGRRHLGATGLHKLDDPFP